MTDLDLTLAGCDCGHDVTLHRRETFTHKVTGKPVPAVVCDHPSCWCFQAR